MKFTDSEQTPDNSELPAEANFVLVSCEQTHNGEVNLETTVLETQHQQTWMDSLVEYLRNGELPANKNEAQSIRFRSARYILYDDRLYKHGLSAPLLRCMTNEEGTYITMEIYEGVCGNHARGQALAHRHSGRVITGL